VEDRCTNDRLPRAERLLLRLWLPRRYGANEQPAGGPELAGGHLDALDAARLEASTSRELTEATPATT